MQDRRKIILGVAMMCFVFLSFVYIMGGLFYAESLKVKARDGFCPQGTWAQKRENITIPGHTAILVDTSNKISTEDGEKALRHITAWIRALPFLQKISVYGLPPGEGVKPSLLGKPWCVPKQGKTANIVYENPRLVETAFKGKFLGRISQIFNILIKQEEADQSPIVETMVYLSDIDNVDSIWLVSDMLQHSSTASHYSGDGDMKLLCKKLKFNEIKIYYIDRKIEQQSLAHRKIWKNCLADSNIEWQ